MSVLPLIQSCATRPTALQVFAWARPGALLVSCTQQATSGFQRDCTVDSAAQIFQRYHLLILVRRRCRSPCAAFPACLLRDTTHPAQLFTGMSQPIL